MCENAVELMWSDVLCTRMLWVVYSSTRGPGGTVSNSFWTLCRWHALIPEINTYIIKGMRTGENVILSLFVNAVEWMWSDVLCTCMLCKPHPRRFLQALTKCVGLCETTKSWEKFSICEWRPDRHSLGVSSSFLFFFLMESNRSYNCDVLGLFLGMICNICCVPLKVIKR